jgi:hypothetical protein
LVWLVGRARQISETRNVLEFVVRASTIPLQREEGDNASDDWEDMLQGRGYDPMEGDEFDADEMLNRRTECANAGVRLNPRAAWLAVGANASVQPPAARLAFGSSDRTGEVALLPAP